MYLIQQKRMVYQTDTTIQSNAASTNVGVAIVSPVRPTLTYHYQINLALFRLLSFLVLSNDINLWLYIDSTVCLFFSMHLVPVGLLTLMCFSGTEVVA